MLVEVINKIDTVYVEKVNNYLATQEVFDLFDKVQTFHNNEYTDFLTELGILITILVVVVGLVNYSKVKSIEKRLDDKIDEFDKRIDEGIKKKVKDELEKQVTDYRNEFDVKLEESIKTLQMEGEFSLDLIRSYLLQKEGDYHRGIELLLSATIKIFKIDRLQDLPRLYSNLNIIEKELIKLKNNGKPFMITNNFKEYLFQLNSFQVDDKISKEIIDNIIETVNRIYEDNKYGV